MDYFRGAKNALYNTYTGIATKVKGVNHKSTFEQDGKLTPEEFEEACEQLCYVCPSWGWKGAVDKAHTVAELPADKQFISTRIVSNERAKDVLKNVELVTSAEDGWIEAKVKEDPNKKPTMKVDDEKQPQIKGAIKKLDSDDEDDAPPAPKKEEITEAKTDASHSNNDKRYYDISITYDRYHHTPRLWLSGLKNDSTPLTNEEIFEDIMSDYAHKTVTIEEHPHLGTRQASIHPCKHAQVIHQLITEAKNNGVEIDHRNALYIFLKFMSSVLPTLEFDYTIEITTNK